jgi:sugar phosphate permease
LPDALGKFCFGYLCDTREWDGKNVWLCSLVGTAIITMLMPLCQDTTTLSVMWVVSRGVQPAGFIGLVRCYAQWVPHTRMGRSMAFAFAAVASGDALSRLFISALQGAGYAWRPIFVICGAVTFLIAAPAALLVKRDPQSIGLGAVESNPHALAGKRGESESAAPASVKDGALTLLRSGSFWLLALMALMVTTSREIFNSLDSDMLATVAERSTATAISSAFPWAGMLGTILGGYLIDRLQRKRNGEVVTAYALTLFLGAGALYYLLGRPHVGARAALMAVAVSVCGFSCTGLLSLCGGVLAIDLGGVELAATASSIVDALGYVGAIAAMELFAQLHVKDNYLVVFGSVLLMAAVCVACGLLMLLLRCRRSFHAKYEEDAWRAN